jgi:eukaryotic-like serine/threonine-protein kinase
MTPVPGDVLAGRYRLLERLGAGGMAQVFRAMDQELHRDVAVKVLAPHMLDDPQARDRLQREARSAAALTHPNVVTLYDTVIDGDNQFLVMEFVDGPTLADRLRTGPLPEAEAIRIAGEVAAALEVAHERGLIHCDIKPANLLIAPDGRIKVTDFGIARVVDATQTTTGQVYGSVPYIAPERAQGQPAGAAADLYALGCVLHEMVTGQPPFTGSTPTDTLSQHLHATPPTPSDLQPGVSPRFDAVVARLLSKDPAARHPDAASLRRDLDRLSAGSPPRDATVLLPAATAATTRIDGHDDWTDTATSGIAATRSNRIAWVIAGLALVAAVAAFLLADTPAADTADTAPSDLPPAASTAPTATATPSPSVSEPPPEPTSPEDAIAELRQLLVEGRSAGLISGKGVNELDKYLTVALKKLSEGKPDDAAKEVQELRKKIGDLEKDGEIDGGFATTLESAADDLIRIVRGS